MSDIDTAVVDSLKVLDPNRPIREADINMAVGLNNLPWRWCHLPFSFPRSQIN